MPIPGSPPTSTREPATMPSPSTRSNSPNPVVILSCSSILISDSSAGFAGSALSPDWLIRLLRPLVPALPEDGARGSSTMVFQDLQPGHCPIHFDDS